MHIRSERSSLPSTGVNSTESKEAPSHVPTTKELFDYVGSRYENAYSSNPQHTRILDVLHSVIPSSADVLDVGCGTGRPTAYHLSSRGHNVTGIDLSPTMVSLSRNNVPEGSFQVADMTAYQPSKKLDGVCAFYALFQLPRREIVAMLYRISSWLRPCGHFAMSTVPYGEFDGYYKQEEEDPEEVENGVVFEWMGYKCRQTTLTADGWKELFDRVGMDVVLEERYEFMPEDDGFGSIVKDRQLWFILKKRQEVEPLLDICSPSEVNNKVQHENHQSGRAEFVDRINWEPLRHTLRHVLSHGSDTKVHAEGCLYSVLAPSKLADDRSALHVVPLRWLPISRDRHPGVILRLAPYNETIILLGEVAARHTISMPLSQTTIARQMEDTEYDTSAVELTIDWSDLVNEQAVSIAASQLVRWMWPNLEAHKRPSVEQDVQKTLQIYWGLPGFRERKLRFSLVSIVEVELEHPSKL